MTFNDVIRISSSRKGILSSVSSNIVGVWAWGLHFVLEFAVLSLANMDPVNILFHFGGFIIGCLISFIWSSKLAPNSVYFTSCIGLGLSSILLALTQVPIQITILLSLAGFCIGSTISVQWLYIGSFLTNPEFYGRSLLIGFIPVALIIILETIVLSTGKVIIYGTFLLLLFLVFLFTFSISQSEFSFSPRERALKEYFNKQDFPLSVLLLGLVMGFFVTNSYYTAIVLLNTSEKIGQSFPYPESLYIFVFVLFLTSIIVSLPCGFLFDKLGRRWAILIGLYLGALVYFLIPTLPTFVPNISEETILLGIFPILIGISLTLICFGGIFVVYYEMAPKEHLMTHDGMVGVFWGFGCVLGVIIVEVLKGSLETQPILLPFVMIFAYLTATIVVNQNKEPLLSKTEQEWEKLFFRKKDAIKDYVETAQKAVEKIEPEEPIEKK